VVAAAVARHHLPAAYADTASVRAGGLVWYGPNYSDLVRRVAFYVDKILKGARPAELPVEEPNLFELGVNLKTAKILGVTIPQSILLRADQMIE
jgi:putative tryptophan/tyrosine transport system substrate-binding protein